MRGEDYTQILTSMSGYICDLIAIHPNSWSPPVNGGGCVSHIREADTFRRGQVCTENTKSFKRCCRHPPDDQSMRKSGPNRFPNTQSPVQRGEWVRLGTKAGWGSAAGQTLPANNKPQRFEWQHHPTTATPTENVLSISRAKQTDKGHTDTRPPPPPPPSPPHPCTPTRGTKQEV